MAGCHVYIMASRSPTLYVGVTNDLICRVEEHRTAPATSLTGRDRIQRLVGCEAVDDVGAAVRREKQRQGWRRARTLELINAFDPDWSDQSERIRQRAVSSLRSG